MPHRCVVDASVGIKLVIAEDLSENADALFAQLTAQNPARFSVPDLFFMECANVLVKYVRRFHYPPREARQDMAHINALHLERYATVTLTLDAVKLATQFDLSAYDACYIALAKRLGVPLVTADERLVNKFSKTAYDIIWLGNLDDDDSS